MTAQALQAPLPTFTGLDGLPLAGGYVYFGEADQDPRTAPIAVYWDEALTIPATQPLRTVAGYLSRNGAATTVFINGECSMLVLDALNRQVFYVASWDGLIGAATAAVVAAVEDLVAEAEVARDAAEDARDEAEAARDSLVAGANIFANTTAGLAGTASGGYFWVPSAEDDEAYILYLDNAGVAVEQKRLPSVEALTDLRAATVPDVEWAIQDNSDNAVLLLESDGAVNVVSLDVTESVAGVPRAVLRRTCRTSPNLTASIVHHVMYGQSLSLGATGIHTLPTLDGGFFNCVMFNANGTTTAGPRAQEGSGTAAQNHASFVAYEERPVTGTSPTGNFETPLGNGLRMIKRLLRDEDGLDPNDDEYVFLGSCPGQSNLDIAALSQGQVPYVRLLADVTYGLALAQADGKSFAVDVVYWCQGERDIDIGTTRAAYKALFLELYTDLNTDIQAITGQAHDIKLIAYQVSIPTVAPDGTHGQAISLAQLDAAKENENIIIAVPIHAIEHTSASNVHLSGFGSAQLSAYFGLCAKRVVIDGGTWPLMYPTRITRQGVILDVEFPDSGYPLEISDTLFATVADSGFTAVRTDLTTDNPVVSVEVISARRVRVVLTDALAGYLRYGMSSWGGNLHDTSDVDPGTRRDLPLYQPVLIFEEAFT